MTKKATQLVHVRMPKELHRKIQREAERKGQTINAEILQRLADAQFLETHVNLIADRIDEGFEQIAENLNRSEDDILRVVGEFEQRRRRESEAEAEHERAIEHLDHRALLQQKEQLKEQLQALEQKLALARQIEQDIAQQQAREQKRGSVSTYPAAKSDTGAKSDHDQKTHIR
jgi:nucleoid DNA-binding protein